MVCSRNLRRNALEFGRTFVVMPKGTHRATIVWLHGIGKKGFNIESMSEDACDDLEGLDASATHVANLLISEPDDAICKAGFVFC
uniref:Phospholipase/carboxylesterase/thioesterase domain-containing protein n=1 Tax=Lactuca sativa TaxID=4236 RepID=A0A9R1V4Q5_LACSA|nr:hypothetical protein LSAT_V11C700379490 [Lactuca sativa]